MNGLLFSAPLRVSRPPTVRSSCLTRHGFVALAPVAASRHAAKTAHPERSVINPQQLASKRRGSSPGRGRGRSRRGGNSASAGEAARRADTSAMADGGFGACRAFVSPRTRVSNHQRVVGLERKPLGGPHDIRFRWRQSPTPSPPLWGSKNVTARRPQSDSPASPTATGWAGQGQRREGFPSPWRLLASPGSRGRHAFPPVTRPRPDW